jgi:hypothetical protein
MCKIHCPPSQIVLSKDRWSQQSTCRCFNGWPCIACAPSRRICKRPGIALSRSLYQSIVHRREWTCQYWRCQARKERRLGPRYKQSFAIQRYISKQGITAPQQNVIICCKRNFPIFKMESKSYKTLVFLSYNVYKLATFPYGIDHIT